MSGFGFLLTRGEAITLNVNQMGLVRFFAAITGDKVTWIAID